MSQFPAADAEIAAFSTPLSNTIRGPGTSDSPLDQAKRDLDTTTQLVRDLQDQRDSFVQKNVPVPLAYEEMLADAIDDQTFLSEEITRLMKPVVRFRSQNRS